MRHKATRPTPRRWRFGPGLLVTAAFIGPGTVTTASRAGAQFGFALLWTLLLAVAAAIVLQEMAARLGLVARLGLSEAIRESIGPPWARVGALALVLTAIVLGNTAYQTGNLMGAGMGLHALFGLPTGTGAMIVGVGIAILLGLEGASRRLPALLIAIVLAMSLAFLATAVFVRPDVSQIVRGTASFKLPRGAALTALALLGTTVVPYNLFLHATAVQKRWPKTNDVGCALRDCRIDTMAAIAIGGLATMAIVATAAAAFHDRGQLPTNAGELARQLEPLLGVAGKSLFAAGLAAAGITSAITAPLAAGYAAAGAFPGAPKQLAKTSSVAVALIGTIMAATFGASPQVTIVAAQAANGVLLPLVALFLLYVMNRTSLLAEYRNGWTLNIAGGVVVITSCGLAVKTLSALVQ